MHDENKKGGYCDQICGKGFTVLNRLTRESRPEGAEEVKYAGIKVKGCSQREQQVQRSSGLAMPGMFEEQE